MNSLLIVLCIYFMIFVVSYLYINGKDILYKIENKIYKKLQKRQEPFLLPKINVQDRNLLKYQAKASISFYDEYSQSSFIDIEKYTIDNLKKDLLNSLKDVIDITSEKGYAHDIKIYTATIYVAEKNKKVY
jgi:hypothetical protein